MLRYLLAIPALYLGGTELLSPLVHTLTMINVEREQCNITY